MAIMADDALAYCDEVKPGHSCQNITQLLERLSFRARNLLQIPEPDTTLFAYYSGA